MAKKRDMADSAVIDAVAETIAERHEQFLALAEKGKSKSARKATSRTVRLFAAGPHKIAQKLGEEAVEAVIEGSRGRSGALVEESVDLLFHLMVLWQATGVQPGEVWAEMAKRHGLPENLERVGRTKD